MSRLLSFYGTSDDIFVIGLNGKDLEEAYHPYVYKLNGKDGGLNVFGVYERNGVWGVGVEPTDEDKHIPNWPMSMTLANNGYSVKLNIEVPDDVEVFDTRTEEKII